MPVKAGSRLSHLLNFFVDFLSRLLKLADMASSSNEYRAAYDAAERELTELLRIQEALEKRIVLVRQNVQGLAQLCESEAIKIAPSAEAQYLLENSSIPDEIEGILKTRYPDELRASDIRREMEKLGHDWDDYTNPLATIHMVLKRLIEADRIKEREHAQGFRVYQFVQRALPKANVIELSSLLDRDGAFFKAISGLTGARPLIDSLPVDALAGLATPSGPPNQGRGLMAPKTRKTMGQRMIEGNKDK